MSKMVSIVSASCCCCWSSNGGLTFAGSRGHAQVTMYKMLLFSL